MNDKRKDKKMIIYTVSFNDMNIEAIWLQVVCENVQHAIPLESDNIRISVIGER